MLVDEFLDDDSHPPADVISVNTKLIKIEFFIAFMTEHCQWNTFNRIKIKFETNLLNAFLSSFVSSVYDGKSGNCFIRFIN